MFECFNFIYINPRNQLKLWKCFICCHRAIEQEFVYIVSREYASNGVFHQRLPETFDFEKLLNTYLYITDQLQCNDFIRDSLQGIIPSKLLF